VSATDWLVVGAAAAMIAGVNWYFFFAERRSKEGAPLRLVFDRHAGRRPPTPPDREASDT